jgi:hypothetical protein
VARLHLFVDGSWLFKACAPERALATRLEYPDRAFRIDFDRPCESLLRHARSYDAACDSFGDRFLSTGVFAIPEGVDDRPAERDDVTTADIESDLG